MKTFDAEANSPVIEIETLDGYERNVLPSKNVLDDGRGLGHSLHELWQQHSKPLQFAIQRAIDIFEKIKRIAGDTFPNNVNRLATLGYRLKALLYYRWTFGSFGSGSYLRKPFLLNNVHFMHIGEKTFIAKGARVEVVLSNPARRPELRIGDNVNIEQNVHIVCHHKVTIGNDVSISPMCSIIDTTHPFDAVGDAKVGKLLQDDDAVVEIGDGSWIGVGVVILPNVRIGKRCIIGANAVVTKDIPDRSVAVGSPARVIRSVQ